MIKRFICDLKNYSKKIFIDAGIVDSNAFANSKGVDFITFNNNIKIIKQSAFSNCEDLEIVDFNQISKNENENIIMIKESEDNENNGTLYIQSEAFKNCKNLHSLILPQEKNVIIEKNAFLGCEHLRNVISLNNEIQINDGAFSACPQDLTFICVENSNADIYSREHGNKVIYVSSSFKF